MRTIILFKVLCVTTSMFRLRQHGGRYGIGKNHHLLELSHHGLVAHYRRRVDLEHGDVLLYPRVHVASLAMIASALKGRIPLHRGDRVGEIASRPRRDGK